MTRRAVVQSSEWQPIVVAPPRGDPVLCYSPGNRLAGNENAREPHWQVDWSRQSTGRFWLEYPEAPYTHWMPLPPAPAPASRPNPQEPQTR